MEKLKKFNLFLLAVLILFSFNLLAQTTIVIEAEDYSYNEDPNGTWKVMDDAEASGGKVLAQVNGANKSYNLVGWTFETTSETDTIYYIWYYGKRAKGSGEYMRHFVNMDGDINQPGRDWPFQYFNNLLAHEEALHEDYSFYWYQNSSSSGQYDSIAMGPGTHSLYFRQRDGSRFDFDKIKITNDLTWVPNILYEWEAEFDQWGISEPLERIEESGASGGSVVATQAGSGTVSQIDIINGNADVGVRCGRVANGDYYVWMLVNLPSEEANTYWIGMGDEGIIPPSWEGAVTSGYEWRLLTDELGNTKMLHIGTNDFNKFHILRIKQQEEGTKIDKYLISNDSTFVPENPVGVEDKSIAENIPKEFSIAQNYPNPFNPTTVISYALPKASHVSVDVYNTLGQKVAELVNADQYAGTHSVSFNASALSSGIYFYTIQAGDFASTKKMLLVK